MLRDGKFVKEPPIKISVYYVPFQQTLVTKEEEFVQHLILCESTKRPSMPHSAKVLDMLMFVIMIWFGVAMLVPILKFIADRFI